MRTTPTTPPFKLRLLALLGGKAWIFKQTQRLPVRICLRSHSRLLAASDLYSSCRPLMKYATLATLDLTRYVPSGHLLLVASPSRCLGRRAGRCRGCGQVNL
jgi:hypothetical protein